MLDQGMGHVMGILEGLQPGEAVQAFRRAPSSTSWKVQCWRPWI
jgi:hypothetical protein